jgi:chromosome segregation ATPase
VPPWLAWSLTLATVAGLAGLGVVLMVLLSTLVALPAFLAAVVAAVGGGLVGARASNVRAAHAAATEAHRRQHAERARRSVDGRFDTAWSRLAELRVQLAGLDLPEAAATDLRSAMRELERRLDGLARVARTTEQTLEKVDASALRTRLKALSTRAASDERARDERDRLARTVADLDAVQERRRGVERELAEVHDALSEVAGVFGQLADPGEASDGLSRLTDTTRLVREAIADEPPAGDSDERSRRAAAARARQGRTE